ncbi:MAG: hypothetical protein M3237_21980 [Actinomycetota bacterium]|nr:hypothetical protein [Actinomycetota bacterium]
MSPVIVLLLLAGLSEATGRVLPLVARRPGISRTLVAGLLMAGALIEATVIALWPRVAWALSQIVQPTATPDAAGLAWTPSLLAPLVVAAVLAFPLLGPMLHLLLLVGVGAGLADPLSAASGLGWWAAAGCIAVAGVGLAVAVELVRRLVATLLAAGVREPIA